MLCLKSFVTEFVATGFFSRSTTQQLSLRWTFPAGHRVWSDPSISLQLLSLRNSFVGVSETCIEWPEHVTVTINGLEIVPGSASPATASPILHLPPADFLKVGVNTISISPKVQFSASMEAEIKTRVATHTHTILLLLSTENTQPPYPQPTAEMLLPMKELVSKESPSSIINTSVGGESSRLSSCIPASPQVRSLLFDVLLRRVIPPHLSRLAIQSSLGMQVGEATPELVSGDGPAAFTDLSSLKRFHHSAGGGKEEAKNNHRMYHPPPVYAPPLGQVTLLSLTTSLLDPLTMSLMRIPVRGDTCSHIQCFDCVTFLAFNLEGANKGWKCPVCKRCCLPCYLWVDSLQLSILLNSVKRPRKVGGEILVFGKEEGTLSDLSMDVETNPSFFTKDELWKMALCSEQGEDDAPVFLSSTCTFSSPGLWSLTPPPPCALSAGNHDNEPAPWEKPGSTWGRESLQQLQQPPLDYRPPKKTKVQGEGGGDACTVESDGIIFIDLT